MIPLGILAGSRHVPAGGGPIVGQFLESNTSALDATQHTFTMGFGAPESTRLLVAAVSARKAPPSAAVASITIGGIAATVDETVSNDGNILAIVSASVPSGTSGDVVVTWSDQVLRCGAALWSLTGSSGTSRADTSTGTLSAPITGAGGGFTVAGIMSTQAPTVTWSGVTERYDERLGGELSMHSGGDASTEGPLSITATLAGSSAGVCLVAVAYQP